MFRYYSTLRPITPGAYPKPADNPAMLIHNFDNREYVGKIGREAWGYVEYNNPLTKEQIEAFDFVAESGGEDKETICKLLCKWFYRKPVGRLTLFPLPMTAKARL